MTNKSRMHKKHLIAMSRYTRRPLIYESKIEYGDDMLKIAGLCSTVPSREATRLELARKELGLQ